MKINVLLVSKLDGTLQNLRQLIQDEEISIVGESPGGVKALDKIENLSPDIIIITLGTGEPDVLSLTERILLQRPRTFIILLLEQMNIETLQEATRVGAHNIMEFPTSAKQFSDYIKTVYASETTRLKALNEKTDLTWMSRVITVFGSKGGLGKTTIAVNIAAKLAEKKKKVALIDLDLQFGDVHIFMDLDPKDTIAELVQEVYTPNIDSVRSYMVVHSNGVHVLCAPKSPEYAEVVTAEKVQNLLSLLRTYFDYVIIDTAPSFNEVTLTAIESSSTVLFVTGLDISILKNSKLSMTILDSLQQKEKINVIVNRMVDGNTITLDDVQNILGCPIWAKVPIDYKAAISALNRGIPIVTAAPNTKLTQSLSEITEQLLQGNESNDAQKISMKKKKKLFKDRRAVRKQKKVTGSEAFSAN
ncbi:AAA family ATPase [Oscillospiraceae bacterium CM]|nr:AAA family ATPase [Oscillospiraceae bacterium CM]